MKIKFTFMKDVLKKVKTYNTKQVRESLLVKEIEDLEDNFLSSVDFDFDSDYDLSVEYDGMVFNSSYELIEHIEKSF